MIIVELKGGLGNQLFQYAAARRLALWHGVPLLFDMAEFSPGHFREYRLHHLGIAPAPANPADIRRLRGPEGLLGDVWRWAQRRLPAAKRRYLHERHFHFMPEVLALGPDAYLSGYWQSELYFADIAHRLLSLIHI